MEYSTKRDEEQTEVKRLTIYIGEDRYHLEESVDGKLNITKISDGGTDRMNVNPRYSNQIELS